MIVTFDRLGRSRQSPDRLTLHIPGEWPDGGPDPGEEAGRINDAIRAHCRPWLMSSEFGVWLHPDGSVSVITGFRSVGEGGITNVPAGVDA